MYIYVQDSRGSGGEEGGAGACVGVEGGGRADLPDPLETLVVVLEYWESARVLSRRVAELPYLLLQLGALQRLQVLLTSMEYLEIAMHSPRLRLVLPQLILLYVCPLTAICVSAYYCMCVVILLYVCPHTAVCVSSYCYVCVRILLYLCAHTAIYVSAYYYVCAHTAMCVLILLYVCLHTVLCVSAYYCMCVLILLRMSTSRCTCHGSGGTYRAFGLPW
jgi:hypothetical protein